MPNYENLSNNIITKIEHDREKSTFSPFAFIDNNAIRRNEELDKPSLLRSNFIRDCDKIIHCPYYNRYADKTQVFSFYKNDDISRRSLHVQLVSRIARTIGKALSLNLELIEAMALGHDIGHTPFGHAGEKILDSLFYDHAKMHFSHNIQSVRVLDGIFPYNITLQTLSGIASHDGEIELCEYKPHPLNSFEEFDKQIKECYSDKENVKKLIPSTLEGCVVRISDIIAYLGKDRQDASKAKIISTDEFDNGVIGTINAEIINNLMVNIIENSYGKPYIKMDEEHFEALKKAKAENYEIIYLNEKVISLTDSTIMPMMASLYDRFLNDLEKNNRTSPIFTHHIDYVNKAHYKRPFPYEKTDKNQIVVDFIASMTDDYFVDVYNYLFPKSNIKIDYVGYFDTDT